jgi:hypothetical protein
VAQSPNTPIGPRIWRDALSRAFFPIALENQHSPSSFDRGALFRLARKIQLLAEDSAQIIGEAFALLFTKS